MPPPSWTHGFVISRRDLVFMTGSMTWIVFATGIEGGPEWISQGWLTSVDVKVEFSASDVEIALETGPKVEVNREA